jgi:glutamate synthase (NADPH/NADH) large chain/glutamate synthase (ferredoxin)
MLAHNGEINTRRGNVNWMGAREAELEADFWGKDIDLLKPIIQPGGSDSAELDNALEALVMSGRNILHAMTMLVPPAWRNDRWMSPELKAFFEYHRCFNEPWDGPAALVFTDGPPSAPASIGMASALRATSSRRTASSASAPEVGRSISTTACVVEKGRLAPGEIGRDRYGTGEADAERRDQDRRADQQPYGEWLKTHLLRLGGDRA